MSAPLVSVVIPTHNRPEKLRRALESVERQTLDALEIVVVNDGGQDVAHVLAGFPEVAIRHVVHATSRERSAARNSGIEAATGTYIAYLDDDDWYEPHHLEALVGCMRATGAKVAYSDAQRLLYGADGAVLGQDVPYSVDFSRDRLAYENYIPILCLMHERACIERSGGFDVEFSALEDWELWVRLARHYDFHHLPVVTCGFEEWADGSRPSFLPAAERLYAKHADLVAGRSDLQRLRAGYLAGLRQLARQRAPRPSVSIVIPTFNNLELTQGCLAALRETASGAEVIVVDNGSTDGTPEFLRAQPDVIAVLNEENRGFAKACNQGLDASTGELVCFLNNDTIPHPGWLEALAEPFADPSVGVAGAKLLYSDGRIQHAGIRVTVHEGELHPFHVHLLLPADAPQVNKPCELQMVTGACLLARRELARFDEAYVNGHEDLDLCMVARERGFKVVYAPDAVVTHLESQTKRLIGIDQHHYRKGVENEEARGRRRFLERWGGVLEVDAPLHVFFTMVGWADEGGGTILPRQIAKALVRRGHRVTVLVAPVQEKPGYPPYHVDAAIDDGVQLVYLWNRPSTFSDPLRPELELVDPQACRLASELVRQLAPDVVHLHSLLGFSFRLPETLGLPSVYTSHNYWPVCPRMYLFRQDLSLCDGPSEDGSKCAACLGQPEKASFYGERVEAGRKMLGADVDRHLAVSSRVRELFIENGHEPSRIHVLHQQPEPVGRLWEAVGASREPVERLERPLRVGFIGSLYAHKGAHVLVSALQAFEVGQVEAHLFGGGADDYVHMLRRLDGKGLVTVHGGYEPEQLPELLGQVDVVCVPSVWEDCAPLVVAEALAARAPVVGSRIGGIPDFVRDGQTGLLVEHGNADALAAGLRRFVDDPALLGRMQAAIEPPRGLDAYLDELVLHYRAAIAERRSRPVAPLEGARSVAVLAFADELAASPDLLAGWGRTFRGGDDVTLVIDGRGMSEEELGALLGPVITDAGLEGEGSADLLAVTGGRDATVERGVTAVLSRRAPAAPLAHLPHFDEARLEELRSLVDSRLPSPARAA